MFGSRFNDEVDIFISGQKLSGIENVEMSYSNSLNVSKPLGSTRGLGIVGGPTEQKFSFSRYLIYNDPILIYTGANNMSGSIHYNGSSYGFRSGYLTDYSVNCAVGNVPKVNAQFFVVDEMQSGKSASGSVSHPTIDIPSQGSISLTCDDSTTNRVVGFDYALKCNRKTYNTIGSKTVADVEFLPPIEYSATVQIEVDDAFLSNAYDFFSTKENKIVSFSIAGRSGVSLQSLTIPKASLVGENLSASADGALRLTLNYIGYGI